MPHYIIFLTICAVAVLSKFKFGAANAAAVKLFNINNVTKEEVHLRPRDFFTHYYYMTYKVDGQTFAQCCDGDSPISMGPISKEHGWRFQNDSGIIYQTKSSIECLHKLLELCAYDRYSYNVEIPVVAVQTTLLNQIQSTIRHIDIKSFYIINKSTIEQSFKSNQFATEQILYRSISLRGQKE